MTSQPDELDRKLGICISSMSDLALSLGMSGREDKAQEVDGAIAMLKEWRREYRKEIGQ